MRIRRFEAPDSKTALALVKAELGDDAVILANRTIPADGGLLRKYGRTVVEVVAATDYDLYSIAGRSDESRGEASNRESVPTVFQEPPSGYIPSFEQTMAVKSGRLAQEFRFGDTGNKMCSDKTENAETSPARAPIEVKGSSLSFAGQRTKASKCVSGEATPMASRPKPRAEDVLRWREQLIGRIRYNPLPGKGYGRRQRVVALVGPTGVGKTTTVAKVAAWARLRDGLKVALVSMDCFRIGATDQLRTYARIMRVPCEIAMKAGDLSRVVEKYRDYDLVLVDTAGKSPYDDEHVGQLAGWFDSIPDIEPYLAISATTKKEDLQAVFERYGSLAIRGLALTKLDETRAYAVLCQQIVANGYPVSCLCVGQRVPEDFLLASDSALGKLFREGWQPFIGAHKGNGCYNMTLSGMPTSA